MGKTITLFGKPNNAQGAQKKSSSLFGSPKKEETTLPKEVADQVNDMDRRLRTLEERYSSLQTRSQVTEENMLHAHKRINAEIKTTNSETHELKKDMGELKDRILVLVKELQSCAKKEELRVLQRYVNLWEPISFVTHNELKQVVEELRKEKK